MNLFLDDEKVQGFPSLIPTIHKTEKISTQLSKDSLIEPEGDNMHIRIEEHDRRPVIVQLSDRPLIGAAKGH
jgi:hypothetical protein